MVKIETFVPALLKTIQRNNGILDIKEAERIYGGLLVKNAIDKRIVNKHSVFLDSSTTNSLKIDCITHEWDGSRPIWLDKYKTGHID